MAAYTSVFFFFFVQIYFSFHCYATVLRQSQLLEVRKADPYYMNVAFILLDNPKVVIFNTSVTRYLLFLYCAW